MTIDSGIIRKLTTHSTKLREYKKFLIWIFILGPIDFTIKASSLFVRNIKKDYYKNIIVKMDGGLGDAVLFSGFIKNFIENNFDDDGKYLIITDDISGEYFKIIFPKVNLLLIDRNKFLRNVLFRIKINLSLLKLECKKIYNFSFSRDLVCGDAIILNIFSKKKIGFVNQYDKLTKLMDVISRRNYTKLIELPKNEVSELTKYEFLLKGNDKKYSTPVRKIESPIENSIPDNFILVHPGAKSKLRRWSIRNFIKIINNITNKSNYSVVITGTRDESDECYEIKSKVEGNIINMCGKTNLMDFLFLVQNTSLVLANETSIVHLGAQFQKNVICITGGGHFGRFVPYPNNYNNLNKNQLLFPNKPMECFGCNWVCPYRKEGDKRPAPCIDGISVEEIWGNIKLILDNRCL